MGFRLSDGPKFPPPLAARIRQCGSVDDAAIAEPQNAPGELGDVRLVVTRMMVMPSRFNRCSTCMMSTLVWVSRAPWFVSQDQDRMIGQGAGDSHALLLPPDICEGW